jgi:hypothetical protein
MEASEFVLLPWSEAREALAGRPVVLRVLTPPYPASGSGELRVLRVREGASYDVVVGYESYRRV